MRIGLLARADYTGLGIQTYDFYRHVQPDKTLVIDLSHLNGQRNNLAKYPGAAVLRYTPYPDTSITHPDAVEPINEFLEDLDLVFTCETPYDYHLFREASRRGIKTVLQYNFELCDHVREPHLPRPDLFMAPSMWRYNDLVLGNKVFVPVPVDRTIFQPRIREVASLFVNSAGTGAMEDRNGTQATMDAWQHVRSGVFLRIHAQNFQYRSRDRRIQVRRAVLEDPFDMYREPDVFVMPRKFGGLCLPLNEALSCGMPILMTDLSPQNQFLPSSSLIPAYVSHQVMTKMLVDIHQPDVAALASRVDELAQSPELVRQLSEHSESLGSLISWDALLPVYRAVFESVMDGVVPGEVFKWPELSA